ncbi:hypothetical protein GMRT_14500 [Giardia muris]|uniref:Uncharacterized protein n=1 Tax=Giardia muris TaxID=5742 RepID=A0A4Z1T9P8_GIAMU|nr:hypothetical protein GMRT_14500 [Giardia muris]|eukprot:TNJ29261.1 hypothetical protein GMRT_14500 [Giardia muris]
MGQTIDQALDPSAFPGDSQNQSRSIPSLPGLGPRRDVQGYAGASHSYTSSRQSDPYTSQDRDPLRRHRKTRVSHLRLALGSAEPVSQPTSYPPLPREIASRITELVMQKTTRENAYTEDDIVGILTSVYYSNPSLERHALVAHLEELAKAFVIKDPLRLIRAHNLEQGLDIYGESILAIKTAYDLQTTVEADTPTATGKSDSHPIEAALYTKPFSHVHKEPQEASSQSSPLAHNMATPVRSGVRRTFGEHVEEANRATSFMPQKRTREVRSPGRKDLGAPSPFRSEDQIYSHLEQMKRAVAAAIQEPVGEVQVQTQQNVAPIQYVPVMPILPQSYQFYPSMALVQTLNGQPLLMPVQPPALPTLVNPPLPASPTRRRQGDVFRYPGGEQQQPQQQHQIFEPYIVPNGRQGQAIYECKAIARRLASQLSVNSKSNLSSKEPSKSTQPKSSQRQKVGGMEEPTTPQLLSRAKPRRGLMHVAELEDACSIDLIDDSGINNDSFEAVHAPTTVRTRR